MKRLIILFLVVFALTASISGSATSYDWKTNAENSIKELWELIGEARSLRVSRVSFSFAQLLPSLAGTFPWMTPFISDDHYSLGEYFRRYKMARDFYDRGQYVAVFKVAKISNAIAQLKDSIEQRRGIIENLAKLVRLASTPPENLSGNCARLQEKYASDIGEIIDPTYRPELFATKIEFRQIKGKLYLLVGMIQNLLFDTSRANQYSRAAYEFNEVVSNILISPVITPADFEGYLFSTTYFVKDFSSEASDETMETVEYILQNSWVKDFIDNKITAQELIDSSVVLLEGKKIKLVLSEGIK